MIEQLVILAGRSRSPRVKETTMLKTISAALIAVSMIAAPALAAGSGKTTETQSTNAAQTQTAKAPAKTGATKKNGAMNSNAKMIRHHRHHNKVSHLKTHPKVSYKPAAATSKRG